MVDSIQTNSSIPLPNFQTIQGSQNPVTLGSQKDISQTEAKTSETKVKDQGEKFETYLNDSSITTLEKIDTARKFDPVSEILAGSVYGQPGGTTAV